MPLRAPKGFIDESDPKVAQVGHPAPAWVVCYADLMTELVCFFVILYALSASLNKDMQNTKEAVEEMMKKGEMQGEVKIDKDGLKISIEEQGGAGFFDSGAAEPTPVIDSQLAKIVPSLRKLTAEHEVLIEGHTDNQPIHNQYFDSNWELSTARATSVTRLLIEKYSLPADRIGAVGYGGNRPLISNATPEGRAKNRRVVIFVKAGKVKSTPPKAASSSHAAHGAPAGAENAPAGTATAAAPESPVPSSGE